MTATKPAYIPETKVKTETESHYMIVLKWQEWHTEADPDRPGKLRQVPTGRAAYFKSNRYSSYSGNLQVEWHPEDGRHWKTAEGASKFLAKSSEGWRPLFKPEHEACVCLYTRVVTDTRTLEPIQDGA